MTEIKLPEIESLTEKLSTFIKTLKTPTPEVLNTLESVAALISITWKMRRSSDECAKWEDFEEFWKKEINSILSKHKIVEEFA